MTGDTVLRTALSSVRGSKPGGPALWMVHAPGDSSSAFEPLLTSSLGSNFEILAADWPGAGRAPVEPQAFDLDGLVKWLSGMVDRHTPTQPVGLVGHSLGATVAVRAVRKLPRIVGLFSIEGNLTAADAYLSGLATAFDGPDEYRRHLLDRVRTMAETADPGRSEALWRYHKAILVASPEALWRIGRGAAAASRLDGLGEEYRALPVPSLYYWSRTNTPPETQEYIQRHRLRSVEFTGGHWPMIEQPQATANAIAAFFQPLFLARDESPSR